MLQYGSPFAPVFSSSPAELQILSCAAISGLADAVLLVSVSVSFPELKSCSSSGIYYLSLSSNPKNILKSTLSFIVYLKSLYFWVKVFFVWMNHTFGDRIC